ncbi:hypothetical protein EV182_001920 [Spiromyces aspiralis]|uniref:Uncharacterized protein n=1 Tax=Spiromyces aspiralis TaxID=68401 RepID=A0ACC1HSG4_9FUNG|nr:hypothetical protein EV182_001920 [Spiromyces aspiralis]
MASATAPTITGSAIDDLHHPQDPLTASSTSRPGPDTVTTTSIGKSNTTSDSSSDVSGSNAPGAETMASLASAEHKLATYSMSDGLQERSVSSDPRVHLSFLLMATDNRYALDFSASTTILETKAILKENWPSNFGQKPTKLEQVRLIHSGRFIEDHTTLEANDMRDGKATVHVIVRPLEISGKSPKKTDSAPKCSCLIL